MRAIVIGAGPAGLASAACLQRAGLAVRVLERTDRVAASWHGHYDRLHLHTPKDRSALPFRPMPADRPRYPSRAQVVEYLEAYSRAERLDIAFGAEVTRVAPEPGGWRVQTDRGAERAEVVVFATGPNGTAHRPDWPGLDSFRGAVLHSAGYRNALPFAGRRVLVIGFGNSGAEIAQDLAEAGVETEVSVRGPVNLLPRELFGIPIARFGLLRAVFGPGVADRLTAPVLRAVLGRHEDYGLRRPAKGPVAQIVEDGRIPLIDQGVLAVIRSGRLPVRPGIERIEGEAVRFADGGSASYDVLLLATGYRVDLRPLLPDVPGVLDPDGRPLVSGGRTAAQGLYFCSYRASPAGQLYITQRESRAIAADVPAPA